MDSRRRLMVFRLKDSRRLDDWMQQAFRVQWKEIIQRSDLLTIFSAVDSPDEGIHPMGTPPPQIKATIKVV